MNAIPTLYNGIQFRSRLEARWACFFDLIGWKYQYEPFDLDGWIPDFLLIQANVLVEVKPITSFPKNIARKIEQSGIPVDFEALIVGCICPTTDVVTPYGCGLGWLQEGQCWGDAAILDYGDGRFGFMHDTGSYVDRIHGYYEQDHDPKNSFDGADFKVISHLWKRAGNMVQWRGPKSITD